MTIYTSLLAWLEPFLVQAIEWLPFVNDGHAIWETISTWALRGAIGGGIMSYPLYQVLIVRYSIRKARRIFRKLIRWMIIIGVLALVIQYAL